MLLAGKNPAHYRWDGQDVIIPGDELFDHYWTAPVEVEGKVIGFDGYPDPRQPPVHADLRHHLACDVLPRHAALFSTAGARPCARSPIWACWTRSRWKARQVQLSPSSQARLIGSEGHSLRAAVAAYLDLSLDSPVLDHLAWLGLFGDDPLPGRRNFADRHPHHRMLEKMQYQPGERDMLILKHEFQAESADRRERITSTMVDFGIPHGYTSMARTVGLPAAIAVTIILRGQIALTGVQVPVVPEIYEPVLAELEAQGIRFVESWGTP